MAVDGDVVDGDEISHRDSFGGSPELRTNVVEIGPVLAWQTSSPRLRVEPPEPNIVKSLQS